MPGSNLYRCPTWVGSWPYFTNIRLGWKGLSVRYTLVIINICKLQVKKSFALIKPEPYVIEHYTDEI